MVVVLVSKVTMCICSLTLAGITPSAQRLITRRVVHPVQPAIEGYSRSSRSKSNCLTMLTASTIDVVDSKIGSTTAASTFFSVPSEGVFAKLILALLLPIAIFIPMSFVISITFSRMIFIIFTLFFSAFFEVSFPIQGLVKKCTPITPGWIWRNFATLRTSLNWNTINHSRGSFSVKDPGIGAGYTTGSCFSQLYPEGA